MAVSSVHQQFFHESQPVIWYIDGMPQISYTAMRICPILFRYTLSFACEYVHFVLMGMSKPFPFSNGNSVHIRYYAFSFKYPLWLVNTSIVTGHLPFTWQYICILLYASLLVISPVANFMQGITCSQK